MLESEEIKPAASDKEAISILVVEDNAAAAMAVTLVLEPFHCVVDIASNGNEAVNKAKNHHYDLILADIGLPDITGAEAARQIRMLKDSEKSSVPIVALTGHAGDDEKRQECFDAGMEEVLSKPVQSLMIESILQRFVFRTSPELETVTEDNPISQSTELSSVIDWEGCVHMCNGDPDFTRQVLSTLAKDLKMTKQVLEKAYINRDTQALCTELHRTRGGVCYLKLPQLEQALRVFHEAVKAEPQNLEILNATYETLQQAMVMFWKVNKEKGLPPIKK